ncbi:hypothetical protein PDK93_25470 [Bacillus cereus]|nr:hypothetical protein [Bacillus cereus]
MSEKKKISPTAAALRKVLEAQGKTEEEIMETVKSMEMEVHGRTTVDPTLKNTIEVAEMLSSALEGTWNKAKVWRIVKSGLLTPVSFEVAQRHGYQFRTEDVEEFIRIESKTKEDWRNAFHTLEGRMKLAGEKAKQQVEELEKQIAALQKENKELQEKKMILVDGYNKDMAIANERNEELLKETKELEETVKENKETITKQRTESEKKDRKIKKLEKQVKEFEEKTKEKEIQVE